MRKAMKVFKTKEEEEVVAGQKREEPETAPAEDAEMNPKIEGLNFASMKPAEEEEKKSEPEPEAEAETEAPPKKKAKCEEPAAEEPAKEEAPVEEAEKEPEPEVVAEPVKKAMVAKPVASKPMNGAARNGGGNRKYDSFQRIDASIIDTLPPELQDNSFQAKFRLGMGDMFGVEGHEKLKDQRGKGFRKEKSKLKNKNFQGGNGKITYNVNSVKL